MQCPRCKEPNAYITTQEDSYTKIVQCPTCQYQTLLKHYNYTMKNQTPEQASTWTITITATVFAGDMEKEEVRKSAEAILQDLTDGSDIAGISVDDATRDEL